MVVFTLDVGGDQVSLDVQPGWNVDRTKQSFWKLVEALPCLRAGRLRADDFHLCLDQRRVFGVEYQNFLRSPLLADALPAAASTPLPLLHFFHRGFNTVYKPRSAAKTSTPPSPSPSPTPAPTPTVVVAAAKPNSNLNPVSEPDLDPTYLDLVCALVRFSTQIRNEMRRKTDPTQKGRDASLLTGTQALETVQHCLHEAISALPSRVRSAAATQASIDAASPSSSASSGIDYLIPLSELPIPVSAAGAAAMGRGSGGEQAVTEVVADEDYDEDADENDGGEEGRESGGIMREFRFEDLKLGRLLGQGSFARVFQSTVDSEQVAVKVLKWDPDQSKEEEEWFVSDFHKEISTLRRISHPNILRFIGGCYSAPNLCILTEFAGGGNLKELLRSAAVLPWLRRLRLAYDVAQAVNYLHTRKPKIVHRDIKAENVMLTSDGEVRLADFGLVKLKDGSILRRQESYLVIDRLVETRRNKKKELVRTSTRRRLPQFESFVDFNDMTSLCGTPAHMAPEIIEMQPFNEKIDVYAYAVFLWELLTRQAPHPGLGFTQIGNKTTQSVRPEIPGWCPPKFRALIEACWEQNPLRRPPFSEILLMIEVVSLSHHDLVCPN
ncbi:MAG: protein kinase [archaeon]|nr:protein kinase [archaeon]